MHCMGMAVIFRLVVAVVVVVVVVHFTYFQPKWIFQWFCSFVIITMSIEEIICRNGEFHNSNHLFCSSFARLHPPLLAIYFSFFAVC